MIIIQCLGYLAGQGLAITGHDDDHNSSFTQFISELLFHNSYGLLISILFRKKVVVGLLCIIRIAVFRSKITPPLPNPNLASATLQV